MSHPTQLGSAQTVAEPASLTRARSGDPEAFAVLYRRHHLLVYRYLLHRSHDRHLAEDLTQEVFLRAWRGIGSFVWQGTDLSAWLMTIARNLYLDEMTRSRTRRETAVAEPERTAAHGTAYDTPALRALDAVEARETLRRALRTLNPQQRHCIDLRYFGELTPEETARTMGRTTGAVKGLTHRALRQLRGTVRQVPA
ncbi:RNA polymerase sigma factor [Streptomyces sp. NPDC001286]